MHSFAALPPADQALLLEHYRRKRQTDAQRRREELALFQQLAPKTAVRGR